MKRQAIGLGALALLVGFLWWLAEGSPPPEALGLSPEGTSLAPPPAEPDAAAPAPVPTRRAVAEGDASDWPTGFGAAASDPEPDPQPASDRGEQVVRDVLAAGRLGAQVDVSTFLQQNAELAARHVGRFCEESAALTGPPFSRERPVPGRDAATFLAPRLDWEASPPVEGTLHLGPSIVDRLNTAGARWPEALTPAELVALDFGWLKDLRAFDSWSLVGDGPARDSGKDFWNLPAPAYVLLVRWAKLRYARGLVSGDVVAASAEVRHLAGLLHSQGVLIAEMFVVSLLRLDREAWEVARARGVDVSSWTPSDPEQLDRYRRLARVSNHFLLPGVEESVMQKALECMPAPCSAVQEAAGAHMMLGDLSAAKTTAAFWKLAEGRTCDPALLTKIRSLAPTAPELVHGMVGDGTQLLEVTFGEKR